MTLNDVITRVDSLRPNGFTPEEKAEMVSRLDAEAVKDAEGIPASPLFYPQDAEMELYIPFPFDDCYVLYVIAQIDLANADMSLYPNDSGAFNARYTEWRAWQARHRPPRRREWTGRYLRV